MNRSALHGRFDAQRGAAAAGPLDRQRRMAALAALRDALRAHEGDLVRAVSADFGGRAADETRLLELLPLYDQIRHARRHLKSWMRPRRVSPTWFLRPAKAFIVRQPLGVVGVISPWNYPVLLTFGPVVDALAAGNRVMIKPSEHTPRTSALMAEILAERFAPHDLTVVIGGADLAAEFAALPFDHLVFTGSTRVGAMVMRAASEHLTPVTLELGGKSPVIVHDSFPLKVALRRILIGKLYNAGQTCVAPDYLLVPRARLAEVAQLASEIIPSLYPRLVGSADYTRIINCAHYERLTAALDDAEARGARLVVINPAGEPCTRETRVFAPTLVFGAPLDSLLMRDEIFGPILPVLGYDSLAEAIAFVNARPRPLALYYFDTERARIDAVITGTTAGGMTINDVVLHLGQHNLPFGGVGASGMGHYHGVHGFETFSKQKGVMVQRRLSPTRVLHPPYTARVRALVDRLLAWSAR